MTVPDIVESALDGEEISSRVSLGGDDELFITPSSTLIYRSDGLLSDESVDEFSHDADRLTLSEGRRKTRFTLEYALEGTRDFTVPASKTEAVLHPVLAGVLSGNGITDPGESVVQTYRFSELTLILTSDRLVKHIGEAVWDADFEQYHFDDVSGLSFEDGSVATQIVIVVDGRPQRIKAPNEHADNLRERLERSLFAYHDVDSLEAFNESVGEAERDEPAADPATAFGEGVDPLGANASSNDETGAAAIDVESDAGETGSTPSLDDATATASGRSESGEIETADAGAVTANASPGPGHGTNGEATLDADGEAGVDSTADAADAFEESGFEPATATDAELLERLESLEARVERQTDLLERQQRTIERLIEELRAGR